MRIVDIEPGLTCDVYAADYREDSDYMRVYKPLSYTVRGVLDWIDAQEEEGPDVAIVGHAPGFTTPHSTELIEKLEGRGITVKRRLPAAAFGGGPSAVEERIRLALRS